MPATRAVWRMKSVEGRFVSVVRALLVMSVSLSLMVELVGRVSVARPKDRSVGAVDGADDHGAGAEVDQREIAGVGGRLDRGRGCERLSVDRLREREWVRAADGRPGRQAGAADDALAAADNEEALHLDAVLAVVVAGDGADDVIVRE